MPANTRVSAVRATGLSRLGQQCSRVWFWAVRVFSVRAVVIHRRDRDAKAALESAESADPQSANVPGRRVLGGSLKELSRIALCLFWSI
jgi:hypothetical protein